MSENSESNIRNLVTAIVKSYDEEPVIIKIEARNQIDTEVISEIISDLREVIFAGFYSKKKMRADSVEYFIGELIERLTYNLEKQIRRALRNQTASDRRVASTVDIVRPETSGDAEDSEDIEDDNANTEAAANSDVAVKAAEITYAFLSRIPYLRSVLATDVEATYDGDPAAFSKDEVILSYPGLFAITVSRLAHELHLLGVPLIPRMMTEYAHGLTGIDIHPGASIGHHFFIDHGTGIVIGETTTIGNYVKIYQGVTLGGLSTRGGQTLSGTKRHPTIGDNVTIYSGASILGGSTIIGEGVVIGSNSFITKSVTEGTKVSIKSPELQYKVDEKTMNAELEEDEFWIYTI
ncbi:MAG: serine acetyltransferase [Clostridiales Family XIII bacterium]|jgi:serine O-acetyltransferase|nr:serine acetyltransferase [Clostridiales Family XIII bacterium]